MRRKPCIALLLCICSCSLDTSPDIQSASAGDASVSPLEQKASLHFDAPRPPRKAAVKRGRRDDVDAGDDKNDDAKPDSRDAGRPASARPATSNARDAGAVGAGDKQASTRAESAGDVRDDAERSDAAVAEPTSSMSSHDGGVDRTDDASRSREQRVRNARGRSGDRDEVREARGKNRERRGNEDADGNNGKHRGRDR